MPGSKRARWFCMARPDEDKSNAGAASSVAIGEHSQKSSMFYIDDYAIITIVYSMFRIFGLRLG